MQQRSTDGASNVDVNAVLVEYGKAMVRIGQLEAQCQALEERLGGQASESVAPAETDARLEEQARELDRRQARIAALEAQVLALRADLSRTEARLKEAAEGAYMRHRRRRKWWKRLLGIRSSR